MTRSEVGMPLHSVLRFSRLGAIGAAALTGVGMLLYPGGTYLDRAATGYSFFQNSLSDLGGTVAWNGQRNPAWPIHLLASTVLVVAGIACFVSLIRVYTVSSITGRLARGAAVVVLLAGSGVIGAALAPHDRHPELHGAFSLLAVGAFPVATALLFVATVLNHRLRRRVPACWLVLTVVTLAWSSMILLAPATTTLALALPVTLQKVVAASLVATIFLQAYEAEFFVTTNDSSTRVAV